MASTCAAMFSARPWSRWAASAWITLATPAIWLAARAASPAPLPATSTCTSPPRAVAALTVLKVPPLRALLSCSAMTRVVMFGFPLDDLGDVLELVDQRGDVGHLDAGAALGRLGDFQGLDARGDVHAQGLGLDHFERLLLGLHDVGQGDVARLVQAQVGGDDRGQAELEGLQAAVDFAGDGEAVGAELNLAGKGGLGQVGESGQHLAGLVAVVVDGLLAQDDE